MVDRVPTIDEIDNLEKLEAYLRTRSAEEAQAIAYRAALRNYPGAIGAVRPIFSNPDAKSVRSSLLRIFRAAFVGWQLLRFPHKPNEIAAIDASFDSNEQCSASMGIAVMCLGVAHVLKAALASISRADRGYKASTDQFWSEVRADCQFLARNTAKDLMAISIWSSGAPPATAFITWTGTQKTFEQLGTHWTLVRDWFDFVSNAGTIWGSLGDQRAALSYPNLLGEDFWGRDPDTVMKEISEFLRSTQSEDHSSHVQRKGWWTKTLSTPQKDAPPPTASKSVTVGVNFFISYSTENEAFAREINGYLEDAGYTTIVQFKDFAVGSNFVTEMQKGLAADRFVALLSPAYVASKQCQAEWNTAYNADPLSERRYLIPLLVEKAELPPLAKQMVYKSLVGLEGAARRIAVLEAVGKIRRSEVSGVTSPYDFELTEKHTISAVGGSMNTTSVLPNRDPNDAQRRLDAVREIADNLISLLQTNSFQVSPHYRTELENYRDSLPLIPGKSIYSADAALRNLRDDLEDDLKHGIDDRFIRRCLRLVEAHYGLRVYFPELLDFYDDVRNARQTEPLPLEALSELRKVVDKLTPDVFEPSVGEAFGHVVDAAHPLHNGTDGHDVGQNAETSVSLPLDPIADIDPVRAGQHAEISMQNRLWGILRRVEDGGKAVDRIDRAVTAYSKFIDPILDWLSKSN